MTLFVFIYLFSLGFCFVIIYKAGRDKAKHIVCELCKVNISNSEKARIAREQISEVYPEFFGKKILDGISAFLAEREYKRIKK